MVSHISNTFVSRKSSFLILFLWIGLFAPALGQNFEEGLDLYKNGEYREALSIFEQLDSPEAVLFTGKSYYSLGQYIKAKAFLTNLSSQAPRDLQLEAQYTSALSNFYLDQFGAALNTLYELKSLTLSNSIVNDAQNLYNGILNYLTLAQRRLAFQVADHPQVKVDIVQSAFGKVDYQTAKLLLHELRQALPARDSTAYSNLSNTLSDSLNYSARSVENRYFAPRGMVYDIGVALPQLGDGASLLPVSQGLYQGYLLATEQFNQRNPDKKAFIRYQNTGTESDSAGFAMNRLAWSNNADLVLGPISSESAMPIAQLAEQYQVPVLAPLANADSLNIDNPYIFQANPTFASHGTKMAEFAVNELNMDTLAVFTEKNSFGEASAYAFRREAERLGAHISHFIVEDLKTTGYDITQFTQKFAPDTLSSRTKKSTTFNTQKGKSDTLIRNSLDGIYAPFTGQGASTLIDLLTIDLQVMESDLTVLGSQEWGLTEIPEGRLKNQEIYFSESFYINSKNTRVQQFREEFKQRFGKEANRYAMIGFDSADFILRILEEVENPALLKDVIKTYPLYEGLISNIRFGDTQVNQEVKVFEITPDGIKPAVY